MQSVVLCGASVRSLAESALDAGLRPWCVDFFADSDLLELLAARGGRYVERLSSFDSLPSVLARVPSDVPLIWSGGFENHPEILREILANRPVFGCCPDALPKLRDPWSFADILRNAGLKTPDLLRSHESRSLHSEPRWLRKPLRGAGGLGIHWALRLDGNDRDVADGASYLQEFIDGVPMSALCVAHGRQVTVIGTALQAIGWQSLGAADFQFCGNIGPCTLHERLMLDIGRAATAIVTATFDPDNASSGLQGVFGIDFILRRGELWFLEVNPRISASHSLYELERPGDVVRSHLAAFLRSKSPLEKDKIQSRIRLNGLRAQLVLWTKVELIVSSTLIERLRDDRGPNHRVADLPTVDSTIPAKSPLCSLILDAGDFAELLQQVSVQLSPGQFGLNPARIADELESLYSAFADHH